jgi:hypothetical protein
VPAILYDAAPTGKATIKVAVAGDFARSHAKFTVFHLCEQLIGESIMGKYLLAWVLGVPAIVLVVIYFFMH